MKRVIKKVLRGTINAADRVLHLRQLMRDESCQQHPLQGDRAIEWSWIVANLPPSPADVLDFGCVQSVLTGISARLGHRVTAIDLRDIEYEMTGVVFRQGDLRHMDFGGKRFDAILNCSTVEHVGLCGRYGTIEEGRDGDLSAMAMLRGLLAPGGRMLLTVPIGRDAVFSPFHRIYGPQRLPKLLDGFRMEKEEYWAKTGGLWKCIERHEALLVQGTEEFYALGLFVLGIGGTPR